MLPATFEDGYLDGIIAISTPVAFRRDTTYMSKPFLFWKIFFLIFQNNSAVVPSAGCFLLSFIRAFTRPDRELEFPGGVRP